MTEKVFNRLNSISALTRIQRCLADQTVNPSARRKILTLRQIAASALPPHRVLVAVACILLRVLA